MSLSHRLEKMLLPGKQPMESGQEDAVGPGAEELVATRQERKKLKEVWEGKMGIMVLLQIVEE